MHNSRTMNMALDDNSNGCRQVWQPLLSIGKDYYKHLDFRLLHLSSLRLAVATKPAAPNVCYMSCSKISWLRYWTIVTICSLCHVQQHGSGGTLQTSAFSVVPSGCFRCPSLDRMKFQPKTELSASGSVGYSHAEQDEMEQLIVSLSKEPTDQSRRQRLARIFQDKLTKPSDEPKRFSNLFDMTLIVVGNRVQHTAQQKAREQQFEQQQEVDAEKNFDTTTIAALDDSTSLPLVVDSTQNAAPPSSTTEMDMMTGKSPEEQQLWALVDMMVQSKTIVKRANGELGSKGAFR